MALRQPRDPRRQQPRAADARQRLLAAGLEVFGRHGFADATTRMLSRAAGVNLQAIAYHFGSKEGLYLATADHIAERLRAHVAGVGDAPVPSAGGEAFSAAEARAFLERLLSRMAGILFDEKFAAVARFIVREQMDPSPAFDRIYAPVMEPRISVARRMVGVILGENPGSQRVRLRVMSLIGSLLFFRIAHATVQRQLGWKRVGPRQRAAIRELVRDLVDALGSERERRSR